MEFLFYLITVLCEILTLFILGRIIISWISVVQTNLLTRFLYLVTEPLMAPLRRILPAYGGIDFSPMVAVIILRLIIFILP